MQPRTRKAKNWFVSAAIVLMMQATPGGTVRADEPIGPKLTPRLRSLLRQEMAQVLPAMQTIYAALVTGDHVTVVEKAQAVHKSFLLERSLTPADRQVLATVAPQPFLRLDRHFHKLAAELAAAGQRHSSREEWQRFEQMTAACLACHGRYVTNRFPGLGRPSLMDPGKP